MNLSMFAGYRATPLGYEQITTLTTATGVTVPNGGPKYALITAETQGIRWRDDGTNPTASVGMPIAAGDSLVYTGNLQKLRIIESAVGAKVNISYYA